MCRSNFNLLESPNAIQKEKCQRCTGPPSNTSAGEVDPDINDEDIKDEIEALQQEIKTTIASLPPNSEQEMLLVGLLLKVCGFIVKVSSI